MNNIHKIARHMASPERQSGQAIVLIAMMMVILLASLGLAIDGGGMFLLWRDAQNAADAAAIQAAYSYCTSGDKLSSAISAGMDAADLNGFDDNQSNNWVLVDRAIHHIDQSELPSNTWAQNVILVRITAEKPAFFIQLVYGGPLTVVAEAMGACNAGGSPYDGYSVFTLGSDGSCGMNDDNNAEPPLPDSANGGAPLSTSGSDTNFFSPIYSNGSASISGSGSSIYGDAGIEIAGGINTNSINLDDGTTDYDSSTLADVVTDNDTPINSFPPLYNIDDYAPSSYSSVGVDGSKWLAAQAYQTEWNAANPSNLKQLTYSEKQTGGSDITLGGQGNTDAILEGLYFFDGNVSVNDKVIIGDLGVSIVATGDIEINTDAAQIWRPFAIPDNQYPLIFTDFQIPSNPDGTLKCTAANNGVKISGNGIVMFGNIYAPNGSIDWSGSKIVYCGSMISWTYASSASQMYFFADEMPSAQQLDDYGVLDSFGGNGASAIDINWDAYAGQSCDYIESSPGSFFVAK